MRRLSLLVGVSRLVNSTGSRLATAAPNQQLRYYGIMDKVKGALGAKPHLPHSVGEQNDGATLCMWAQRQQQQSRARVEKCSRAPAHDRLNRDAERRAPNRHEPERCGSATPWEGGRTARPARAAAAARSEQARCDRISAVGGCGRWSVGAGGVVTGLGPSGAPP